MPDESWNVSQLVGKKVMTLINKRDQYFSPVQMPSMMNFLVGFAAFQTIYQDAKVSPKKCPSH